MKRKQKVKKKIKKKNFKSEVNLVQQQDARATSVKDAKLSLDS